MATNGLDKNGTTIGIDGSGTMKAVVWEGKVHTMSVQEVPRPTLQTDDDVLVKITMAGICGTDLHTYDGLFPNGPAPWQMGHEGIGSIISKGTNVKTLEIGDKVIIPGGVTSPEPGVYGSGHLELGGVNLDDLGGLQAEYARVPSADINCFKYNSTSVADEDAICLSDIFCTGWGSLTNTGFQPGDAVVVFGCGPVGLMGAYSALLRGASRVYSVDHVPSRLSKAESIGSHPVDLTKGSPAEQILKLEPAGVKRVIDCCGFECVNTALQPQEDFVVDQALQVVASGGGIFLAGVYWAGKPNSGAPKSSEKTAKIPFNVFELFSKNVTIGSGTVFPGPNIPVLLQLIESGRAKPSVAVDIIDSIDKAPELYRKFSDHVVGKALIRFS